MVKNDDLCFSTENCPVKATLDLIGGKWKTMIIYLVSQDINRFGKLEMVLRDISKQMLTTQLRELERDGVLERVIHPVIPPKVEYFLTPRGRSLLPIIHQMKLWGEANGLGGRPHEVAA
jgi:DNA-binding HxlR family transcriptional regulator